MFKKYSLLKNKILGLILIGAGYLLVLVDNDGTALLIFVPLGVWFLFARKNLID